jgi:glycosyltransferase involved in cell wall biosynthesis
MKLSFIVPAYNEEAYLGECLDSILRNASERYHEIIVVDNASTDLTSEIALSYAGVRVVYEGQQGITCARQRGLEEATGDILAYVDADTRLPPMWMGIAERAFEQDDELVCLSGPYRYYDGPAIKRWLLNAICWIALLTGYLLFGYMLNGGDYVVKKRALVSAGGFNKAIDFFGEDTDIGRRLFLQGKVAYSNDFFILTSARRFYAEGLFRANAVYLINFLWVAFFHRPFSTSHLNIRALFRR